MATRSSSRTASPSSSTISRPHLDGMKVDFVTNLESSGFVFRQPERGSPKCACGKSFG